MQRIALSALVALAIIAGLAGCNGDRPDETPDTARTPAPRVVPPPPQYGFRILDQHPHDTGAFTQGLVFHEGRFLESTGLNGRSSLREVEIETGRVIRRFEIPASYFAEGLALLDGRLYQLTWRNYQGFVYDLASFKQLDTFRYTGEGWGLATDGTRLIMSDGTSQLRFLSPEDQSLQETVTVKLPDGRVVEGLNELEWIDGEVWANIYTTDQIVRIDPKTGAVTGIIDLSGLLTEGSRTGGEDVLNGIAYDPATKRIFVTGKLWPAVFQIEVVPKQAS